MEPSPDSFEPTPEGSFTPTLNKIEPIDEAPFFNLSI